MAQRSHTARFMPGAWVFPGGVVDHDDWSEAAAAALVGVTDPSDLGWLAAALRETVEETGMWLGGDLTAVGPQVRSGDVFAEAARSGRLLHAGGLTYFANWITPADLPVRFDARFYLATTDAYVEGSPDEVEMDEVAWIGVSAAAAEGSAGGMSVPFPTLKTLEWFDSFGTSADLVAWARSLERVPVTQPRMRVVDDVVQIVLPWDPGYDDLPDIADDVDLLEKVVSARGVDGSPVTEMRPLGDG